MNEFLEKIGGSIEQQLRGPAFSRLLERFGVHPKRYWLLLDLFGTLSKRGEMQNELGRERLALKTSAAWFLLFSGIGALSAFVFQARPWLFAAIVLGIMAFTLIPTL